MNYYDLGIKVGTIAIAAAGAIWAGRKSVEYFPPKGHILYELDDNTDNDTPAPSISDEEADEWGFKD